ncbi:M50 family metallopeptidase [Erythrobacter sp. Alg231-14]|uniref:M50 family metallopeptidase n=1 Tax=Erythrobacter sp. Alg231-14 TaxID=1922225 RepID=UPI000D557EBE
MQSMVQRGSKTEQVGRLLLALFVVITLPYLPFGAYLTYPFTILTTWFHEMGHGLAAMMVGQEFIQLVIYANGSGFAQFSVDADMSRFSLAFISAGGLLAPTAVGCALIMASAHPKLWRSALWFTAGAIFASVILYVRSPIGYSVLPMVGVLLSLVAWKGSDGITRFVLQFLGVLGAISMRSHFDYLFVEGFMRDGQMMLSDTGQIEAALLLPHWFWAVVILAIAACMVVASFKYALSDKRRLAGRSTPGKAFGGKRPANVLQFKRRPDD